MWKHLLKGLEWVGHGSNAWTLVGWFGFDVRIWAMLIGVVGWAMTFFSSAVEGWSYTGVWIASVVVGALCTVTFAAVMIGLAVYRSRNQAKNAGSHPNLAVSTNAAPSITAELNSAPMVIDDYQVAVSITVQNQTGEYLDEKCLVKLLEMSSPWPATMPRDFVLRTESQIQGRRSARFNFGIGEKKTIPIVFQWKKRRDFLIFIDENIDTRGVDEKEKSKHQIPMPNDVLELVLETSGAAVPGRYLLKLTKGQNWTIIPDLTNVSANYTLAAAPLAHEQELVGLTEAAGLVYDLASPALKSQLRSQNESGQGIVDGCKLHVLVAGGMSAVELFGRRAEGLGRELIPADELEQLFPNEGDSIGEFVHTNSYIDVALRRSDISAVVRHFES